ncbi:hypothetical protein BJ741DRAFT_591453 [Chytriomyces cf. hyalinus JEL632]|nr:hypothetical protein BJ741DRAFT_591453 [Chytriomyces cf. hyalinus JEL632]
MRTDMYRVLYLVVFTVFSLETMPAASEVSLESIADCSGLSILLLMHPIKCDASGAACIDLENHIAVGVMLF